MARLGHWRRWSFWCDVRGIACYLAHRITKTQFAKDAKVGYATETAKLIARREALLAARHAERGARNGRT